MLQELLVGQALVTLREDKLAHKHAPSHTAGQGRQRTAAAGLARVLGGASSLNGRMRRAQVKVRRLRFPLRMAVQY